MNGYKEFMCLFGDVTILDFGQFLLAVGFVIVVGIKISKFLIDFHDTDVSLSSRTSKANSWNADAYISIHHDSGVGGTSGGGATVFIHPSASAKAKTLRGNVYNEYIKAGGIKGNCSLTARQSTPLPIIAGVNLQL